MVVSKTMADTAINLMQIFVSNNGVTRKTRCEQAQTIRAKKFQILCKSNYLKLLFAPVDNHRSIGVVERLDC